MQNRTIWTSVFFGSGVLAAGILGVEGSSHREAPAISAMPRVDATDVYLFQSYDPVNIAAGPEGAFTTIISNFYPLQDAFSGPSYFFMDPNAFYRMNIDIDGDAREDLVFEFDFQVFGGFETVENSLGQRVPVPFIQTGPVLFAGHPAQNLVQDFSLTLITDPHGTPMEQPIGNATFGGAPFFFSPIPDVGRKTIPDYSQHEQPHLFEFLLEGFDNGRVFVGQRRDPFAANLGEVLDLFNTDPSGPRDGERNAFSNFNVTSFVLEVPTAFLTAGMDPEAPPVIGVWCTASLPRVRELVASTGGVGSGEIAGSTDFRQVSRLGMPLLNEVLMPLGEKDRFNATHPSDDFDNFAPFLENPGLAVLLNNCFPALDIPDVGREDLVRGFLQGVDGINQTPGTGDMLRLNLAIPPTPLGLQSDLGVLGGDAAGFPNGRRPGDDVLDIVVSMVAGTVLSDPPPDAFELFTDGVRVDPSAHTDTFPYLVPPIAGSPNDRATVRVRSTVTLGGPFDPVTEFSVDGPLGPIQIPLDPSAPTGFFQMQSDISLEVGGRVNATGDGFLIEYTGLE